MINNIIYEDFLPERLAKLRLAKKVSARDMSLSIGQNENYINRIENKKNLPSMQVFFYICEYLGVTPSEFFDEGNGLPETVRRLTENIRKLDDKAIIHISGIVDGLVAKR